MSMLLDRGLDVCVIDDGSTGRLRDLPPGITVIGADICDLRSGDWKPILSGIDVVYHLAARKYRTPNVTPESLLDSNIKATEVLARAAAHSGVQRLVFTSSLYAYGSMGPNTVRESDPTKPTTLYGISKLAGEQIVEVISREIELQWNCARLFFTYGPGQFTNGGYKSVIVSNFEKLISGQPPTICGSGTQELDYTYVEDMVEALWLLGQSEPSGHVLNVSTGRGISINDLTSEMLQIANSKCQPVHMEPDFTEGSRRVGDPSQIAEVFGWRPSTQLAQGLQKTWEGMQDRV